MLYAVQCSCSSAPAAVLLQQCSSSSAPAAVLLQQQKCLTICSPLSSDTLRGHLDSAVYQFNNLVLSSESISTAEILHSKPKQWLLSQKIEEADFLHESSAASQTNLKAVSQLPGLSLEEQPFLAQDHFTFIYSGMYQRSASVHHFVVDSLIHF